MKTEDMLIELMDGSKSAFISIDRGDGQMISALHGKFENIIMAVAATLYSMHKSQDIPLDVIGSCLNDNMDKIQNASVQIVHGEVGKKW